MTFRDTTPRDLPVADLAAAEYDAPVAKPEGGRETLASVDPIRRYLVEATRTPLLSPEEERRLAQRMARRRSLFLRTAAEVPAAWPFVAALVRRVLRGERPASKVFMIGGVSEAEFHRHLSKVAPVADRLDELARDLTGFRCGMHEPREQAKAWREGSALVESLKIRLPLLVRIVRRARRHIVENARLTKRGRLLPCVECLARADRALAAHRGFVETRNRLVSSHLRLVVFIAKQVARHPSQILELIQEGNFGLLYATEKYDARERCQFHSYAYWWIRQSMTRAVQNKSRLIRIPVNLQEAPARIREAVMRFRTDNGRDPTPEELRDKLGLTRTEVERHFRATVRCYSLDQGSEDGEESSLSDVLADPRRDDANLDAGWALRSLEKVLGTLAPREREIILLRFGLGHDHAYTLEDVAKIYNLSRERVRQIEIKAIEKLRHPRRAKELKHLMEAIAD